MTCIKGGNKNNCDEINLFNKMKRKGMQTTKQQRVITHITHYIFLSSLEKVRLGIILRYMLNLGESQIGYYT